MGNSCSEVYSLFNELCFNNRFVHHNNGVKRLLKHQDLTNFTEQ